MSSDKVFGCNPEKRARLIRERYLDLFDMAAVFDDPARLDFGDSRFDYGEERRVTIGRALDHIFTVVYTMRGTVTWLITAWPANRKERALYAVRNEDK